MNTPGWIRELVERHEVGVLGSGLGTPRTSPRRSPGCETIPTPRSATGRNARRLAEREFDRELLAARALAVLQEAAG